MNVETTLTVSRDDGDVELEIAGDVARAVDGFEIACVTARRDGRDEELDGREYEHALDALVEAFAG